MSTFESAALARTPSEVFSFRGEPEAVVSCGCISFGTSHFISGNSEILEDVSLFEGQYNGFPLFILDGIPRWPEEVEPASLKNLFLLDSSTSAVDLFKSTFDDEMTAWKYLSPFSAINIFEIAFLKAGKYFDVGFSD